MAPRPKDKKKLDARFRHRVPQVWTAARVELDHPVDTGDDFDRPDLIAWLRDGETVTAREVPHSAPDDVLVALFEEALTLSPDANPTTVRVLDAETAAALAGRLSRDVPVVVAEDALDDVEIRLPHGVGHGPHCDHGRDDATDRAMLDGAKVTADALRPVLTALGSLHGAVPWDAMPPWDLAFVLSAPTRGLPDVSVVVHAFEVISIARTVATREGTLTWARRERPRGSYWLDVAWLDAAEHPALTAEAAREGWHTLAAEGTVVALTAMDVEDHPRRLVPADLDLAALVTRALAAWYREERPIDRWDPTPVTVAVEPDVTLTLRSTGLSPLTSGDMDEWLDLSAPALTEFGDGFPPHEELLTLLRDAGKESPPDVEERVLAAGADAVPALCEELALVLDGEDPPRAEWYARWILLALARIGDPRALPYVIDAAVRGEDAAGDFVAEDAVAAFAAFGPAAVKPLTELLASPCLDPFLRVAAGTALYVIGVDHPGARPAVRHVLDALYEVPDGDFDPEETVAALLADKAARTGDDALYAKVIAALEGDAFDPMFVSRANLEEARAAPPWTRSDHPDMDPIAEKLRQPEWCA